MSYSVLVVADSANTWGGRLTTFRLRYPLCIHAEFMTHREFSRNAGSSRAIPVWRMIEAVRGDPFIPEFWFKNERGMQGRVLMEPVEAMPAKARWLDALDHAIGAAEVLNEMGVHKQIVNRLLAPFAHITVIVTSSSYSNFLGLRCHEDAEPHMRVLAHRMKRELDLSQPRVLKAGEWHLPFVRDAERVLSHHDQLALSVARCASTSYMTVDAFDMDLTRATKVVSKLMGTPMHASPLEHQAFARLDGSPGETPRASGNFGRGWVQYRKLLSGEYITDEVLHVLAKKPAWSDARALHQLEGAGRVRSEP